MMDSIEETEETVTLLLVVNFPPRCYLPSSLCANWQRRIWRQCGQMVLSENP